MVEIVALLCKPEPHLSRSSPELQAYRLAIFARSVVTSFHVVVVSMMGMSPTTKLQRFSQMRAPGFADCHRLAVFSPTQGSICLTVKPLP